MQDDNIYNHYIEYQKISNKTNKLTFTNKKNKKMKDSE